jgi:hypothetical protein
MINKVWVVSLHYYEETHIYGIFTTEEQAELAILEAEKQEEYSDYTGACSEYFVYNTLQEKLDDDKEQQKIRQTLFDAYHDQLQEMKKG